MKFIDLHRYFVPITNDQEPDFEIYRNASGVKFARKYAGWLSWPDLLKSRRVVLLAEALSGKTQEFKHQSEFLFTEGKPAFYMSIEDLADGEFEEAFNEKQLDTFTSWRDGNTDAWFFLDSVDEARLNRKRFDRALKCFRRNTASALERAYILISCRISDWKGYEDRQAIKEILPIPKVIMQQSDADDDTALLAPIFEDTPNSESFYSSQTENTSDEDLLVIQITPLLPEQQHALAAAAGVPNVENFIAEIERNGLQIFMDRPGDLLELAEYWKEYRKFDTLEKMTEKVIEIKLRESDGDRPDNDILPLSKAREGAERIAAALTLGKSFTLRTPGQNPDLALAQDALDPTSILPEWTDAQRNALVRRGIFAPSTYGRVRFHHRSTQEYLTAKWFKSLLTQGCPTSEIWNLMFVERYGVETIPPSLRPAAAWLSLFHTEFLNELIKREPLVLLRHGDPRSLPLEAKKRLLRIYAEKHARGDIADDRVDGTLLHMFADEQLAQIIEEVWYLNDRIHFRNDLMHLIGEGSIQGCVGLTRNVASDPQADENLRITALRALKQCGDRSGLKQITEHIKEDAPNLSERFATYCAEILYPYFLSTKDLLKLLTSSQTAEEGTISELPMKIEYLYTVCPNAAARVQLILGIADLCFTPPLVSEYERVSRRYNRLAQHLSPIARQIIEDLGDNKPPASLVRLLLVIERSEHFSSSEDDEEPTLSSLVRDRIKLTKALFWADVAKVREDDERHRDQTDARLISVSCGRPLWKLTAADLNWLYDDVRNRVTLPDRELALSAILQIVRSDGNLENNIEKIRQLIAGQPRLEQYLDNYLTPPPNDDEYMQIQREHERINCLNKKKKQKKEEAWITFRDQLRQNPSQLSSLEKLKRWNNGSEKLFLLTNWLIHRTKRNSRERAALEWPLLEEGFSNSIAKAYRDGMKTLWRLTRPERPKPHPESGAMTIKHVMPLSFAGIAIESTDNPNWAARLSDDEVKRAARHGCVAQHGYPNWFDDLVNEHPQLLSPILKRLFSEEWTSEEHIGAGCFQDFVHSTRPILPPVKNLLLDTILRKDPKNLETLNNGVKLLPRLMVEPHARNRHTQRLRQKARQYANAQQDEFALRYIAMLFFIDSHEAVGEIAHWLQTLPPEKRRVNALHAFGVLFSRHDSLAQQPLEEMPVHELEDLIRIAYQHIRPQDDITHSGVYTPNARDHAQDGRHTIFQALINKPGEAAYRAILRLKESEQYTVHPIRLQEIAREKAERDSELSAWTAMEVLYLEKKFTSAIQTGENLLRSVMMGLENIKHNFEHGDYSSKRVLKEAKKEVDVQHWLAEQLKLRGANRYHVHREIEVAKLKEPDIVVSATTASCEVAIEVKNANKDWTLPDLEDALRNQLAENYLKPASRRHGVLVITLHTKKSWRPQPGKTMTFYEVTLPGQRPGLLPGRWTPQTIACSEVTCPSSEY